MALWVLIERVETQSTSTAEWQETCHFGELVRTGERSGCDMLNDIFPAHVWKEWGNPRSYADIMECVQAEIRNVPLPNASNKRYGLRHTHGHRAINGTGLHNGESHRPTCSTSLTDTHKHDKQPSLRMSSEFPDLLRGWVTELSLYVYLRWKITELHHDDGTRSVSDSEKC